MANDKDRTMIKDWKEYRDQALKVVEDGYIPVFGPFCRELEEVVLDCIVKARLKGCKNLTFLISSTGGDIMTLSTIRGAMSVSGIHYTGLVIGRCFSAAFNLLQACDRRLAVRTAYLMFHWGTTTLANCELTAIINGESWILEFLRQRVLNYVQIVSQRTGVKEEELKKWGTYERTFTARDALENNLIDEIIPDLPDKIKLPAFELSEAE